MRIDKFSPISTFEGKGEIIVFAAINLVEQKDGTVAFMIK